MTGFNGIQRKYGDAQIDDEVAMLWARRQMDTLDMARQIGASESEVYAALHRVCERQRAARSA